MNDEINTVSKKILLLAQENEKARLLVTDKGAGGEYDKINCGIGCNVLHTRGYNDGFFITCDESTCYEDGSSNNGLTRS